MLPTRGVLVRQIIGVLLSAAVVAALQQQSDWGCWTRNLAIFIASRLYLTDATDIVRSWSVSGQIAVTMSLW